MGHGERQRVGVGAILSDRRVTAVLLVVFIVMAGAGMVLPILPLFARSFGVGYGAVGVLVSAYGLARLVFDLAAGPIVDRFGERLTAVGGLAVIALGSALTGIASGFAMAVVAWASAGVGSALALAALYTRVLRVVPTTQMARTLGIFYGAFNTGVVAGGALSGLVADRFGLAGPLLANAAVVTLAALLWLALSPAGRAAPAGGSPDPGGGGNLARLLLAGWAIPLVGFRWAFALAAIPTAIALALIARTPETLRPAEVG